MAFSYINILADCANFPLSLVHISCWPPAFPEKEKIFCIWLQHQGIFFKHNILYSTQRYSKIKFKELKNG